jgi:hypothetical protein
MARPLRAADGGYVYHALNRSSGRVTLFDKDADFEAFGNRKGVRTLFRGIARRYRGCMARPLRAADGGYGHDALNRAKHIHTPSSIRLTAVGR